MYDKIIRVECDGNGLETADLGKVVIMKKMIEEMSREKCHEIEVFIKY